MDMMDHTNNKTLKLTTGAMIVAIFAVLLLINRQTGGFFEEFFIYILPIPMVAYASRYDWKSSLPVFVSMCAFSFFFGTFSAIFYAISSALLGLIFGTMLYHKVDMTRIMITVMLLAAVFNVVSTIALASVMGYDINGSVLEMQSLMNNVMSQAGVPQNEAVESMLTLDYLRRMLYISLVIMGLVQGYLVYRISLLILKRLRVPLPQGRPLSAIHPPKWTGVLAMLLFYGCYYLMVRMQMGETPAALSGLGNPETIEGIVQTIWVISYMYLLMFGIIGLPQLIRRYLTGNRLVVILITAAVMLLAPQLLLMAGFLYIALDLPAYLQQGSASGGESGGQVR